MTKIVDKIEKNRAVKKNISENIGLNMDHRSMLPFRGGHSQRFYSEQKCKVSPVNVKSYSKCNTEENRSCSRQKMPNINLLSTLFKKNREDPLVQRKSVPTQLLSHSIEKPASQRIFNL